MRRPAALLVCVVFGLALRPVTAASEDPSPPPPLELSLAQAVDRAVRRSEEVRIHEESLRKAESRYKKVRAEAMPQVNGRFAWDRYIEPPVLIADFGAGSQRLPVKQDHEMQAGISLSQAIYSFGKVTTALDLVRKSMSIERLSRAATANELAHAVRGLYLAIRLAERTVEIAEESHRNALENQKALTARIGGGRASRVDNIKMAADVESRIPPKLSARSRLDSLVISLKSLIGAPDDVDLTLTEPLSEEFPEYSYEELEARMLAREPSLKAAKRAVSLNAGMIRLRKIDYFPAIGAVADYSINGESDRLFPSDKTYPMFIAGLRLSVPLWDSGIRRGRIEEAVNDRKMAELRYAKGKREAEAALKAALSDYRSSIKVYRANKAALKLAEDSYRIALSSFKAGIASQSQLNDAELQATAAKLTTERSLYDINLNRARIERLTEPGGAR